MSPATRLPLYLTKADVWTSGPVDPISAEAFIAIVQRDAALTMNIHRLIAGDRADVVFTCFALSPAFLTVEASERRRSFLYLEHGNIVALAPSALLFDKMKALALAHGWCLQDRDCKSVMSVPRIDPRKTPLDLTSVEWLVFKTAMWSEANLPPDLGFDEINGY